MLAQRDRRTNGRVLPVATAYSRAVIVGSAVVCAVMLWLFSRYVNPVDNEFFNFYAGVNVGPHALYDPEAFAAVARSLHSNVMDARLYYLRMPYYAVLTAPLGWFPFGRSMVLWQVVQSLAIVLAAVLWPAEKSRLFFVTLLSLPAVCTVVTGSDTGILLLFAVLSAGLVASGRSAAAGAVFAFCIMKPHLVFLVPLVMALRRDYRFLMGAAAATVGLLFLSFVVAPLGWPFQWLTTISDPRVFPFVAASPGLRALVQTHTGLIAAIAIATTLVIAVWIVARRCPVEKAFAVALAAGLIVNVHSLAVDCILLIPLVAMALESQRVAERIIGVYLAVPMVYLAMIFGHSAWVTIPVIVLVYLNVFPIRRNVIEARPPAIGVPLNSPA